MSQGEELEKLVAEFEEVFAGTNVEVRRRDYIRGKSSGSPREVDVTLRGKLGSSDMLVMIECRDRKDVADVRWLEQLKSKRDGVNADKVVAVSSAGFSKGAKNFAEDYNIELRVMEDLDVAEFVEWFGSRTLYFTTNCWANVRMQFWSREGLEQHAPANEDDFFRAPESLVDDTNIHEEVREQTIRALETENVLTLKGIWISLWKQFELPTNHPRYDELAPIEGTEWEATPRVRLRRVVVPHETVLIEANGMENEVGVIAVAFDWWQEQKEVPVTKAGAYRAGENELARIGIAGFDSPDFEAEFVLHSVGEGGEPQMRVKLRAKDTEKD